MIALALVAFAIFVRVNDPVPVQIVRNLTFDYFQQLKPRAMETFPIAILDVDDPSLTEIGQWPWPRSIFAELVTKAKDAGAVALAFDIIFSEPDRLSPSRLAMTLQGLNKEMRSALSDLPDNDALLARAMSSANVIVGQTSVRRAEVSADDVRAPPAQVPHAIVGGDPLPFINRFPELVENLPELETAARGRGLFTVRPDPDGVYRRIPVVMSVAGQLRLGLGPEMLRVASGGSPFALRVNEAGIDGVVLAGQLVRTAADGTVRPYLNASNADRFISAADLLNDRVPKGRIAGHLLFVGTTAIGLEDYRATPLGEQMAGVEIHAQVLENILGNTLLWRPNYAIAVELMSAVMLCLVIIVLTPIMNALILIISSLLFLSAYGLISWSVFVNQKMLIDPTFPIISALLTIMFMSAANYLREEQRRRQIRNAFGQYVSKDLVDELSDAPEGMKLGGETRDLTLLFSDVRGFTSIAESYRDDPGALTRLMNRFLTLLSNPILDSNGTIDKFMGDAVMAFWNAPVNHPDHMYAACQSALSMVRDVDTLNEEREAVAKTEGRPFLPINVGIGINTGTCTVGNMGSDARFDYTAMGDPVNLASRLEGQSRYYGAPIIVGSSTHKGTQNDFAFLELDLIRVKGKQNPERIFALLGDAALVASESFKQVNDTNEDMLSAYRRQDWATCEARMAKLETAALELEPRLKDHFSALRMRIIEFRQTPPPENWSGVHDATSK